MKSLFVSLIVITLAITGCKSQLPATRPTQSTAQLQPPSTQPSHPDYGRERYRLVSRNDEIVSVLDNGATVIVKRVPSPVVSVRGYVRTGGVYEGKWLGGGLSHLLEHLVAGGSSQRRTEAENRALLQQIGNNSNAYTSEDHTAYFVNTTAPHMEQAVDLVTGWMLGALITPAEYHREYQVVQRELEMGKGEPDRQFWYLSAMNRYQVSPARVPVIGYQSVIQGLSRDDVYNYYNLAYQPNNMVFSVAGDLDPETMLSAVQKNVADSAPGRVFDRTIPAEPPVVAPRTLVAAMPRIGQAKLELAFPTISLHNPDLYALDLLATILGQGESSLLVEQIRDQQQLASIIVANSSTPEYASGSFEIYMQLPPNKIPAATQSVLKILDQVKREPLPNDLIARAKTQMRAARVRDQQTSESIASSLASDYLTTGDPHFSDRYLERIEKVTPAQLQSVAQKYFDLNKLLTTSMFPSEYLGAKGLPLAEDLIRPVAPTTQEIPDHAAPVTRTVLDNGTILLVKRMATTPLVSVQMYSLGGLTSEDAATNGIGNLTMEMLPRGTQTRSAQQIASFFDSIGGEINTSCGNNSWLWTASFLKKDLPKAFEVFADVVNNPVFPDSELAPMKQRILAAIAGQDASWSKQALRYFRQQYFAPSHSPYQFQPIGTRDNVSSFTIDQLRKWYFDKVLKSRRVLAIYGDVNPTEAQALAAKFLGAGPRIPSNQPALQWPAPHVVLDTQPSVNVKQVDIQKTQQPLAGIVIGFKSNSIVGDPANYPIDVADTMASGFGYPTGYLHEILRGQGLVYVVAAQNWPGRSDSFPGTFLVYAGCESQNATQVIDIILQNIARLQSTPADMQESWFHRSKQLIVTEDAMANETPSEQATSAALDELLGLGYNYHDKFAPRINAVRLPDVQSISRQRLRDCVVTVSTPAPELVTTKPGPRTYTSFPPVDLTPRGVQHDMPVNGSK